MSLILAVLLQVGPAPGTGSGAASQLPPEIRDRKPRAEAQQAPVAPPAPKAQIGKDSARERDCVASIAGDPEAAAESAELWRDAATGEERARADLCLGMALSEREDWSGAEAAFLDGRDAAIGQELIRASMGSMAGNVALAQGAADRALTQFDAARAELGSAPNPQLATVIGLGRARALVALGRLDEAEAPLSEVRGLAPDSAEAWLLSATLSRRLNKLAEAQARIEKAAQLLPIDPEIGLEAGVIAMLSGREEAARKSWQSVLAAAPKTPYAETARGYLAQLSAPVLPARPTPVEGR